MLLYKFINLKFVVDKERLAIQSVLLRKPTKIHIYMVNF